MRVWPGEPYPLGATWDGTGVNFALFSRHAEKVELCLFGDEGARETERITVPEYTDQIWHCYLPDARPGHLYGYRVSGAYDPKRGHRFNHHKLLLDPYAKALAGTFRWTDAHFGYQVGHADGDFSFDTRDNAADMYKCRVVEPAFTWGVDAPPRRPWHETTIYELHVRGFTMRHPDVPEGMRGTFAGLADPAVIRHLQDLGITAVELLPIHAFIHDRHLVERGLANYWGYNSIGFFAPHPEYLCYGHVGEVKTLVRVLHDAGIEVILDVVYNHTAEGNRLGPTLSLKGIDNLSYYRLVAGNERHYMDFTGCGNALNVHHPRVLQLVTDSLRYWVEEIHVDGFRFDLATTLAREVDGEFDNSAGFLDAVGQDPVLSRVKLIAEPWDTGPGGYRLSGFPPGWAEWNDRYRDTVRRFWKGDAGQVPELASRITGSSDLFNREGRRPWASVNFIAAHDGFTLHDLVSYNDKHNEANLEGNADGHNHNFSWNCGVEGPTDNQKVRRLRFQQQCNMIATLFLSQGVPLFEAGDEFGRTQQGNNNAYCQDSDISWVDWTGWDADANNLLAFVRGVIDLCRDHIVFHRHRFFHGKVIPGTRTKDITWLLPDGTDMKPAHWQDPELRSLAFLLSGAAGTYHLTARGEGEADDSFFVIMNARDAAIGHVLPKLRQQDVWELVFDTSRANPWGTRASFQPTTRYDVKPRSFVLLREQGPGAKA